MVLSLRPTPKLQAAEGDTGITGPSAAANATGFYATLLENRRWWAAEMAKEEMMDLKLPSKKTATNGTWLEIQAHHNIILSMITKHDTWGPRYAPGPRPAPPPPLLPPKIG